MCNTTVNICIHVVYNILTIISHQHIYFSIWTFLLNWINYNLHGKFIFFTWNCQRYWITCEWYSLIIPSWYSPTTIVVWSTWSGIHLFYVSLRTQGWFYQGWIHSDVKGSNGDFWHWQVSGLAISCLAAFFSSSNVDSVDFASFQPLRS